jgi:hypothetical protein
MVLVTGLKAIPCIQTSFAPGEPPEEVETELSDLVQPTIITTADISVTLKINKIIFIFFSIVFVP